MTDKMSFFHFLLYTMFFISNIVSNKRDVTLPYNCYPSIWDIKAGSDCEFIDNLGHTVSENKKDSVSKIT